MLTAADIQWIKSNREEVIAGRTEVIDAHIFVQGGSDPITKEPTGTIQPARFEVIWNEVASIARDELKVFDGITVQQDDVIVTFAAEDDPAAVDHLIRGGRKYKLIAISEKGLGARNRWTCLARKVI